jgi:methylenetetrahydrofolate reductase (NADPH)
MKTESVLEKVWNAGQIAVTGECGPPRGALPDVVREKAELLRGYVDAINVTDNQTAMVRMSSFPPALF